MPQEYKDLIVDEPDGRVRYNLVTRDGAIAAHDVRLEISSPILQQGDKFGAAEVNTFIHRDENGIVTSNFISVKSF